MTSKGKILLMDDEQIILDVTREVFAFLGYDVEFARDGQAALDLYKQAMDAHAPFDAVILDLSIPEGMGGREAIQKFRELDPHVKAIVSSGYSNDPVVMDYAGHGFSGKLSKPYKINDMKVILEQLLQT